MAWTQQASIKGPAGDPGAPGADGADPQVRVDGGYIQWRAGDDGTWANLIAVSSLVGAPGADGTGVTILGSYPDEAALIAAHPTGDPGDAYLVDGDLYVWSEADTEWVNVGNIQGPKGDPGTDGADGAPGADGDPGAPGERGATWFTGSGTPGAISGQRAGDLYLDTQTGVVYVLEA